MSFSLWNDEQDRPIQHLRVIDLSIMVPGPYVTRILAQYGADVVKVEHIPDGDPLRSLKQSSLFELLNRGKRSVAVDLKTAEGQSVVRQLAAEADVFVENFREGVMENFQLDYASLSEENPDLLYFSLRGMGGKNAVHAGHDLNFIASSGVGEWFLESGPNYSTQFGDMVGGTLVPLLHLLVHLANPARRGMHLVTHMDECFRAMYLPRAFDSFRAQERPEEQRPEFGLHRAMSGDFPHSRYYRCRDKQWISLNAIQEKHWRTFCEVVDKPDWRDRMWDTALVPEVERLFQSAPASYWEALTADREACLFRVIPWEEHLSFSQARPQLSTDPLTWAGFVSRPDLPPAPELGRDTQAVVGAMGLPQKSVAEWFQNGILHQADKKP